MQGHFWNFENHRVIVFNFNRFRNPPDPVIFFAENLPMGCSTTYNVFRVLAPSELPQNAIKPPIYDFVVQPRNYPEIVVKVVLMPV